MSIVAENLTNIPIEEQQFKTFDKREMEKYALLSNVSYDTYYHNIDIAQKNLNRHLPKHKINAKLSDNNSSVIEQENGDVIISYRGTNPYNISDVIADVEILSGLPISSRFNESLLKYDVTKKEYPKRNIKVVGHSLGATEALYVANVKNSPAYLYNVGSSPIDVLTNTNKENIKIYHTVGDVISLSNKTMANVKNVEPKNIKSIIARQAIASGLNVGLGLATGLYNEFVDIHGLHNFMPDEIYDLETYEHTDLGYKFLKQLAHKEQEKEKKGSSRNISLYEKPKSICFDKLTKRFKFCNS
jgi:hypothetical protein